MDAFRIGDLVSLDGRTFTLRGFDPMSLPEQTVELVDTATGASTRLPLARLAAAKLIRANAPRWRWLSAMSPRRAGRRCSWWW